MTNDELIDAALAARNVADRLESGKLKGLGGGFFFLDGKPCCAMGHVQFVAGFLPPVLALGRATCRAATIISENDACLHGTERDQHMVHALRAYSDALLGEMK